MFTRQDVKALRIKLDTVLAEFAEKEGLGEVSAGHASFSGNNITFKLNISAKDEDGNVITKEAEDFRFCAYRYGLQPDDLGKTFKRAGETYEIVGCKPRAHKYPILAKSMRNGKVYKFPADTVKHGLSVSHTPVEPINEH
jgi:hypothetical protein